MGALANFIERAGVATASISLIREQSEAVRPPRALWVPFALGRPFGSADDPAFQKDVMRAALGMLATATEPTIEDYPVEEFAKIVAINLHGTFHVNKALVPTMRAAGYGRIVNIASIAGKEGNPNASAYSASKAGVIGLTKSLGKELSGEDIAVNCVTPAAARTRIFDQMSQEHIDYMLSKIPRGRFLEVEEAARMIAWLASPENSFTTGAVFDLSGGRATY